MQIAREIDPEVVQGQVGDRHPVGQVLKIDHRVLQLLQLCPAIFEVIHLVVRLELDDVLFAGCRNIKENHPATDPAFEVKVFVQLHVGPEVDQLDARIWRTNPVHPAEALDNAHRVPVDVVVDKEVAVLKVLAFGDTVGSDQEVDLAFLTQFLRPFFGTGREGAQDRAHVPTQTVECRFVRAPAGDERSVNAQRFLRPARQLSIEVFGCIGEGREEEHLLVFRVDRAGDLRRNYFLQPFQFRIPIGTNRTCG